MALTKLVTDLENIQALSDTPNATEGLTADELKAKFDKAPTDIKTYLNDTLTAEVDTALGLKLLASLKAVGADITTGTEDTKYVTAKAIGDADLNTRLKSKIIQITRDGTAESGDVSYTGIGFRPTSLMAISFVNATSYDSIGFSSSIKASSCRYNTNNNVKYDSGNLIMYSDQTSFAQGATVKSYDEDGFTLTWTKTANPSANTITINIEAFR